MHKDAERSCKNSAAWPPSIIRPHCPPPPPMRSGTVHTLLVYEIFTFSRHDAQLICRLRALSKVFLLNVCLRERKCSGSDRAEKQISARSLRRCLAVQRAGEPLKRGSSLHIGSHSRDNLGRAQVKGCCLVLRAPLECVAARMRLQYKNADCTPRQF